MSGNRIFSLKNRAIIEALVETIYTNPFSERFQELNREVLGSDFVDIRFSQVGFEQGVELTENQETLIRTCRGWVDGARKVILKRSIGPEHPDYVLYEHLIYYLIYQDISNSMDRFIARCIEKPESNVAWTGFKEVEAYFDFYLKPEGKDFKTLYTPAEVCGFFFQIRRAYYNARTCIAGSSVAVNELRARVWDSIFTHNMRRYLRSLYTRMNDIYTLIVGPSGSGKDVVARCIGLSRYIPFDVETGKFERNFMESFFPINLSALSSTLVESELFGHRRGAFTGALEDNVGYFESAGRFGTIFLDEIGDTDPRIQVKLLRVLQSREFQRLGDTRTLNFEGKVMAATNVDLPRAIKEGTFREDFYYRLCADKIETPTLEAILTSDAGELEKLVRFVAYRTAGAEEVDELTEETLRFVKKGLPQGYKWPGNFRELEQCVRNVMVHGDYIPHEGSDSKEVEKERLEKGVAEGRFSLNQLMEEYVTQEYERTPNMAEVGMRLRVDPRTIKKYLRAKE